MSEPGILIDNPVDLKRHCEDLAAASGRVGVDAERAGSYRYSHRAYLIQVFRTDGPALLIDPIAIPDLSDLAEAISDAPWIIQAAHNDLPCLAEVGLVPDSLFDTEIAAQLLGEERVGLAALVEQELDIHMPKGHGQADWSKRPLRPSWLEYAALDVEVLPDLADRLHERLVEAGKWEWAEQEFEYALRSRDVPDSEDRWQRTSGLGRLRTDEQRGVLQAVFKYRDELARNRDIAVHRIARDAVLVDIARALPTNATELAKIPGVPTGLVQNARRWLRVISEGRVNPRPRLSYGDDPPGRNVRSWEQRDPDAALRLRAVRGYLAEKAAEVGVWPVNLLGADTVAEIAWRPPEEAAVGDALTALGARPWQVELTAEGIDEVLRHPMPPADEIATDE